MQDPVSILSISGQSHIFNSYCFSVLQGPSSFGSFTVVCEVDILAKVQQKTANPWEYLVHIKLMKSCSPRYLENFGEFRMTCLKVWRQVVQYGNV